MPPNKALKPRSVLGEKGRLLFYDVQSKVNTFLEVVNVSESKSIALDTFDKFVSCFKLGVRIRQFNGIDDIVVIAYKGV